ncbi:glycosyltransferase family 2 protein [Niabella terrae]
MKEIWIILQICLALPLWFPLVLWLIARMRKRPGVRGQRAEYDIGIIVTAYQQTDLLDDLVQSILKSNYQHYLIYIVADDCDISNLQFESEKVVLLRPPERLGSNIKSHFYAIDRFRRPHELLTILDSDNLMDPGYLPAIAACFDQGYQAVQGVRAARNTNTLYARLDEAGDMFYRYIDRKLLFEAGSSASLAGSGMAFTTELYVSLLKEADLSGAGFDKYLQYMLVRNNYRIAFTDRAVVMDGKTSQSDQLVKQRARWINTWFKYWIYALKLFVRSLTHLNWNQFGFSMMLLRPPMFMLGMAIAVVLLLDLVFLPVALWVWLGAFMIFAALFVMALRSGGADGTIYKSLLHIPRFVFFQVKALLKSRVANKISVATKHDVQAYKK